MSARRGRGRRCEDGGDGVRRLGADEERVERVRAPVACDVDDELVRRERQIGGLEELLVRDVSGTEGKRERHRVVFVDGIGRHGGRDGVVASVHDTDDGDTGAWEARNISDSIAIER